MKAAGKAKMVASEGLYFLMHQWPFGIETMTRESK
jgi:hypothetical protein